MSFERSLKAAFCAVVHNKRRAIRENDDFLFREIFASQTAFANFGTFLYKKKSMKYLQRRDHENSTFGRQNAWC